MEERLNAIHTVKQPVGHNIHFGKTNIMFNSHAKPSPFTVDGKTVKEVYSYMYIGKKIVRDGALLPVVKRRIVPC